MSTKLPDPGPRRYWLGVHNPSSIKTPMTLELRERTNSGPTIVASFSRLIAKAPTIADEEALQETAREILVRAGKVDEFVGIIPHEEDPTP